MHIPKTEINKIQIESFEDALKESMIQSHIEYSVLDWLYVPNHYDEYRYILGTTGKKPLICIGINPSTASPMNLDNTLKSVERIALNNGFDSFIMFNVYAQRATRPEDMDKEFNLELHKENMKAFEYILSISESNPAVWAAWGNIIEMRPYLKDCLRDMLDLGKKYEANWVCVGPISKKGHPHHPLYLKKDSTIDPFDIQTYIDEVL